LLGYAHRILAEGGTFRIRRLASEANAWNAEEEGW
jgi:hypothetical protein